jgi:hypothetical protein
MAHTMEPDFSVSVGRAEQVEVRLAGVQARAATTMPG